MAISDQLREAIRESGKTAYTLAKECGVPQPMLWRFMNGEGIQIATADKLAAHFGLTLTGGTTAKKAAPTPEVLLPRPLRAGSRRKQAQLDRTATEREQDRVAKKKAPTPAAKKSRKVTTKTSR